MKSIVCEGSIAEVVVHDRGAVVTRRVHLPKDLSGDVECVVDRLVDTPRPGTARVRLSEGGAELIALRTRIVHPEVDARSGELEEKLRELERKVDELSDRREVLRRRQEQWESFHPSPGRLQDFRVHGPGTPIKAALDTLELAGEKAQSLAEEAQALDEELDKLRRQIDEVRLTVDQLSRQTRVGEDAPFHQAVVHLSNVEGLDHFDLSYVVDHARWWPSYTVHLDSETKTVRFELEAQVAQKTGSDWHGVHLALSTAGLATDANLPKLPSLRIGRSAPPAATGYRAAPEGTDDLFAGFDNARRTLMPPASSSGRPAPSPRRERRSAPARAQQAEFAAAVSKKKEAYGARTMASVELDAAPPPAPSVRPSPAPARSRSAIAPTGGPPAPTGGAPDQDGFGGSALPDPRAIEPADQWLDFQHLTMAPPSHPRRGKLIPARKEFERTRPGGPVAGASLPAGLVDPRSSRGHFDIRYEGDGHFEIPADGQLHTIRLSTHDGDATWRWRTAPRAERAVYREISLTNPLPTAILDGRARIFIDGEFAANSDLRRVDRGGQIRIGLGVEERIQVRRNARYEEASQGFLKGRRALDHTVEISLRSSLGHPVTVEVVDRVPVTDDDSVDVELLSESPSSVNYDQADLGQPIRGGRQWTVELGAGASQDITFGYRVQIRSRDELIGGNRREN